LNGVPVPETIARERLLPYLNTRAAVVRDWSCDGRSLYITTRFCNTAQLHQVDMPMGARRQLTFSDEPVASVRVAPAGFAVIGRDQGGGEDYQIHRLDPSTGRLTLLTDGHSRNASFELSRDGRLLAFNSNARNGKDLDVWIMDPLDPRSRRLLCPVEGDTKVEDFSPDATRVLVTEYLSINESYLHEIDVGTGKRQTLTPRSAGRKVAYANPRYAADGRSIHVLSDRRGEFRELVLLDPDGREASRSAHIPWDVEELTVSPDRRLVAFTVDEDGLSRLVVMDGRTGREVPLQGLPRGVVSSLRFDPAGKRLAFSHAFSNSPGDVYTVEIATGRLARWTQSEVGGLNTSGWVEPELIRYPTFDTVGGKPRQIPAFYFPPRPRADGKPSPVVIVVHGGPESQFRPLFSAQLASWLEELGVAVVAPNVRGSDGYGKSYLLLDNGMRREDSVKDIGALLDWIKTRPELDLERVAIYGGSYGGYMVLASLFTYPDRIRAGVDVVGISNFVTFLKTTKEYRRDLRRAEYGDERDPKMAAFLESISPLTNAAKIRSPLLCIQGANDPRVPASEAEQIVKAIRSRGVDGWYVLARNEGHGFAKRENQDVAMILTFEFFRRYLLAR
jgi:dipeptidyl aminopeptidase/acylaminoacyl peptidase